MAVGARPVWMEKPALPIRIVKIAVLVIITVVMLYPFVWVVSVSFSNSDIVSRGGLVLWPRGFNLDAYKAILQTGIVTRSLIVSILVTLVGTAFSITLTVMMAHGLSRTREVPGSKFILYLAVLTLLFGAGIIPNYLLVRALGMLDTYEALFIPGAISAFNLVVVRNFFMALPSELLDSARIDGASEFRLLWSVILPLSKAVIAVNALFYGVALWGNYFSALIYLDDPRKWPVQLVLNQYVIQGSPLAGLQNPTVTVLAPEVIKMAVLVLATVPILIAYPFLQRYFTKGVIVGAIKS